MGIGAKVRSRIKAEFTGRLIASITGALLTILLARLLDPNEYGLLFLAIAIFSIGEIFSKLGLARSAARYVSVYRDSDAGQIPHIIRISFLINIVTITITCITFIIGNGHIATLVGESELAPILGLGAAYIAFASTAAYSRYLSQGFEDIQLAAKIKVIYKSGHFIFAVAFVLFGFDVYGALMGYVLGFMFASAFGIGLIYKRYYRNTTPSPTVESGLTRRIVEYNIPLTFTGLAGRLDKQVDTILVGFFLNPTAVSFYVISKQVVGFIEMPAATVGFATSPTYGKQKASNQLQEAARMFEKSLVSTLLLYMPAAAGLVIVAAPAIELVFGSSYVGATPVLQVLSIYALLLAVTKILDHPLDYLGRARSRAVVKGVASVSNVLLNILLIPIFGVVGAAVATVITHSFYVSVKLYIISTELPMNVRYLLTQLGKIALVTAGMVVLIMPLTLFVTGDFDVFVIVGAGIMSWALLSYMLGLFDESIVDKTLSTISWPKIR